MTDRALREETNKTPIIRAKSAIYATHLRPIVYYTYLIASGDIRIEEL